MYEDLLERNIAFISKKKCYRSYDKELKKLVAAINTKNIATISGLRHTGKTKLVYTLLKKTQSFETSFYYNSELDILGGIKNHQDFIILFDLYVRIYGIPKIIILQNTNNIEGIKTLISKLYSTKKYKIIVVGNNIKIQGVTDIEIFPLGINEDINSCLYGGIPEIRVAHDTYYKNFLLSTLRHDIISQDILESYNIKNISLFYSVIGYLALNTGYYSLREIHRNLKDNNIDISLITMIDYINAALNTKFLSKCERYDIKNDNIITSKTQYFFGDVGLRRSFSGTTVDLRENLIYLELLRKGYSVNGGINGKFSFEFYASKDNTTVCLALDNSRDKGKIRKTARKLAKIGGDSQKYVIVQNKNSLHMRKFEESGVQIIEIGELLEIV